MAIVPDVSCPSDGAADPRVCSPHCACFFVIWPFVFRTRYKCIVARSFCKETGLYKRWLTLYQRRLELYCQTDHAPPPSNNTMTMTRLSRDSQAPSRPPALNSTRGIFKPGKSRKPGKPGELFPRSGETPSTKHAYTVLDLSRALLGMNLGDVVNTPTEDIQSLSDALASVNINGKRSKRHKSRSAQSDGTVISSSGQTRLHNPKLLLAMGSTVLKHAASGALSRALSTFSITRTIHLRETKIQIRFRSIAACQEVCDPLMALSWQVRNIHDLTVFVSTRRRLALKESDLTKRPPVRWGFNVERTFITQGREAGEPIRTSDAGFVDHSVGVTEVLVTEKWDEMCVDDSAPARNANEDGLMNETITNDPGEAYTRFLKVCEDRDTINQLKNRLPLQMPGQSFVISRIQRAFDPLFDDEEEQVVAWVDVFFRCVSLPRTNTADSERLSA